MIVVDASVLIPWLEGLNPGDRRLLDIVALDRLVLAPVTFTEMLSGPKLSDEAARAIGRLPVLPTRAGYWRRAGLLRQALLKAKRRARLGHTLIAQACLDHDLPLLARDRDFAAFAELAGLRLA